LLAFCCTWNFPGSDGREFPSVRASRSRSAIRAAEEIEKYLRHLYAFGPEVKLTIPEPKESEVAGLLVTTVELVSGESHDTAKMYLSKDGKF